MVRSGLPTIYHIDVAKKIYEKLKGWQIANQTITEYFQNNPRNDELWVVLIKVVLIDRLYFTNLKSPINMARHIVSLNNNSDLDNLLTSGDINMVERIGKIKFDREEKERYCISFASKYCHFRNKKKYALYDKYALAALRKIPSTRIRERNYGDFITAIEKLKELACLEAVGYEDLDKYLWLYGQKIQLDKHSRCPEKAKVNKEITELYRKEKELFDELEPKRS